MKYPHLILLYGRFGDKVHEKQQKMINSESTCMYREFAKAFGEIIYLCPQVTKESWDSPISDPQELIDYLYTKPDAIVWSVKYDPTGQKNTILRKILNKTVYYSCCAYHITNSCCDISLCDTPERVKGNGVLWVKGKDPEYWKPTGREKVYDYIMIGKRGDKNEAYFINRLTKEVKEKRNIVWVGGHKHQKHIKRSHHYINLTPFVGVEDVKSYIDSAKVGIILSEIPAEGFPQTFLEMTMMGVPVVYMGPINNVYFSTDCCLIGNKGTAIYDAELILKNINEFSARQYAINNYSLEKSYDSILRGLNV